MKHRITEIGDIVSRRQASWKRAMTPRPNIDDCRRIYEAWHACAQGRDVDGLLALYAEEAVLESPLVPAICDDHPGGVLRGRTQLRRFIVEGTQRRPNQLVRWYRTGEYFTDGRTLIWEYPRKTPTGEQVDLVEVMEIEAGLIVHHRIYWGWFGVRLLTKNASDKIRAASAGGA